MTLTYKNENRKGILVLGNLFPMTSLYLRGKEGGANGCFLSAYSVTDTVLDLLKQTFP